MITVWLLLGAVVAVILVMTALIGAGDTHMMADDLCLLVVSVVVFFVLRPVIPDCLISLINTPVHQV